MKPLILLTALFWTSRAKDTHIVLKIVTDGYGEDVSWALRTPSGVVIDSSAGTTYGDNQEHREHIDLDYGDYEFEIEDSIGDGLCCMHGTGYYAIYDDNNREILHSNPEPFATRIHKIRLGYQPAKHITARDIEWLKAHNKRRQAFHVDNGHAYVPLMWSNVLKAKAQDAVDHAVQDCEVEPIHTIKGVQEGENVFSEEGKGSNLLDRPEEVVMHWVDQYTSRAYPDNMSLTQVYWRATKYVGCASGSFPYEDDKHCERHVCMYIVAGNCDMGTHKSNVGDNWKMPTLQDYSSCSYICPSDGCYVSDFDGL